MSFWTHGALPIRGLEIVREEFDVPCMIRFASMTVDDPSPVVRPFGVGIGDSCDGEPAGQRCRAVEAPVGTATDGLHHPAKAKRVIYLFMSGGPSHHDLWDYKPKMQEMFGKDLPEHIRDGQRITGMTAGQKDAPGLPVEIQIHQARKQRPGRLGQ